MRRFVLSMVAVAALATPTMAQVVDDPLHGACTDGGCLDNSTVTPATAVELENGFGWSFSGSGTGMGALTIAILIPNTDITIPAPMITGSSFTGTRTFASVGAFNSGDLATLIFGAGVNASPANPIGGFEAGDAKDKTATSFSVFDLNVGNVALLGPSSPLSDIYKLLALLPEGAEVVGFLQQADGSVVSTALSGDLQVSAAAVPAPLVGAGLPGVLAGLTALWGFARRRRSLRA